MAMSLWKHEAGAASAVYLGGGLPDRAGILLLTLFLVPMMILKIGPSMEHIATRIADRMAMHRHR